MADHRRREANRAATLSWEREDWRLFVAVRTLPQKAGCQPADFGTRWSKNWMFVAARNGGMTIYHFGRAKEGLHVSLGTTPTLRAMLDKAQLRRASKLFDKTFPTFIQMRHAIAHSEEAKKHSSGHEKTYIEWLHRDSRHRICCATNRMRNARQSG